VKLLDVDWHEVFDLLPKWEALTSGQRRFLIEQSVGTLFVIDRASVQRAVMAGRAAEEVIATAGDLSK